MFSGVRDRNLAGSTTLECQEGLTGNESANYWSKCAYDSFQTRIGPNYTVNKRKASSNPSLFEIVGVDFVASDSKLDNIGSRVHIPDNWATPSCGAVPSLFIVNCQLPSDFSTSFFKEITDGPGWSMILYFKITEATSRELQNMLTASPAVRLLDNYCRNAPDSEANSAAWKGRFKVTVRCENIEQYGLPSFITAYNGKPVLIKQTGTLARLASAAADGTGAVIEMDINVHRFGSVPKKALQTMMSRFHEMDISVAIAIESREDDEMPEVLLGCCTIHRPLYDRTPNWNDSIC